MSHQSAQQVLQALSEFNRYFTSANSAAPNARISVPTKEWQALHSMLASALAFQPAQVAEPFGYFRALPFGWTECAETDEGAIALYEHPTTQAVQQMPEGWVPLTITHEDSHPEEVAYGPQIMMDRLKKWLDKYFALRAVQGEPVVFDREKRYIVFKLSDIGRFLTGNQIASLYKMEDEIAQCRKDDGKATLKCVVVESDWPEYGPTWQAIEDRVTGKSTHSAVVPEDVRKAVLDEREACANLMEEMRAKRRHHLFRSALTCAAGEIRARTAAQAQGGQP